jgi:fatty acid desaturase
MLQMSFTTLHLIVPYYLFQLSFVRIFLTYALCDAFWSLYLMLVFQASHVNDEVMWPKPDSDQQLQDWAVLQIESSMDFAHGSWLTTFLVGSLNYQAVHHLFPHVRLRVWFDILILTLARIDLAVLLPCSCTNRSRDM